MSVIIALNDDYEGGEFYFPKQDYKVKLKKGDIICFPPYHTHPLYHVSLYDKHTDLYMVYPETVRKV